MRDSSFGEESGGGRTKLKNWVRLAGVSSQGLLHANTRCKSSEWGSADTATAWGRKATDLPPPFHRVQGLASSNQDALEGHWEGTRVETPESPIWQVAVEREVHRGSAGLPRKHQGRVHQCRKEAAGGCGCERGGGRGGRGRAGPAKCVISYVSFLGMRG